MDQPHTTITIQFTPEQRRFIYELTGYRRPSISLSTESTLALSLAAFAAQSEVLPVSTSWDTIEQMLRPVADDHSTYVLNIDLTDEQKDQLGSITKVPLSSLALAPDEWEPAYEETWQDEAGELRIGQRISIAYGETCRQPSNDTCFVTLPVTGSNSANVFGTGRHRATQLALELLESRIRDGDRVLDVGTGSGIIAVAAARLGAFEVLALDTDPTAVATAQLVVNTNKLEDVVAVKLGSLEAVEGQYDIVVANIFAHVIISMALALAHVVRPQGILIVSGIVSARAGEVIKKISAVGFKLEEERSLDVWHALVFTRTQDYK
jgi:ribosomal protein L11 methyltransferase